MRRSSHNPGDNLVKLHLVSPFDLDPTPDRSLQGRLDRVLKSVGAKSQLSVRARMITAVSSTKFKTLEGHPVSLVGLHGKDELLVSGPDWAVENLGRGDEPDASEIATFIETQQKALAHDLQTASTIQAAVSVLRRYLPRVKAFESRPEFKTHDDGWGREPKPQFLQRPAYNQNTKALQAEYDELLPLSEAVKFASRYFEPHRGIDDDVLMSTEAAIPTWIASIQTASELIRSLQTEAEAGKHPWWFTWTKEWSEFKARVSTLPSADRPKGIQLPHHFSNDRGFLAFRTLAGQNAPEA